MTVIGRRKHHHDPMPTSWVCVLTMSMLPEIAGVAISVSPIGLVASSSNVAPRLDDEDVAIFARQIEPAVGGDRRRAESCGGRPDPLLIDALAGLRVVGAQDAVVGAGVEDAVVEKRRSGVRCAAIRLPGERLRLSSPEPPGRIA